jgi:hypothetical protein
MDREEEFPRWVLPTIIGLVLLIVVVAGLWAIYKPIRWAQENYR